ncbi:tRNA threonylcarbamoyladenosine dehydratase [Chryseobacterium sp.]|uniref:tRNA threonylcarbamoyladenosine dehydratase n=1 Tax=Chryseobacterium sp. TaxID=1871047 RepID=UPI0028993ECE|nr:tRNA threonylcarbamoyladenosine dehydratase [Chryseobacterium sp.]
MDKYWLERTELLIKEAGLEKLHNARVLVVGLGGVGSFAAEFLARAGIGNMTIVDGDTVDITNVNRQLPALHSTVGQHKVDVVGDRLLDINPKLNLIRINEFLNPERMEEVLDAGNFDYVLDCIDSVTPKLSLIIAAKRRRIKIVSSMGAGGKTDPSKVLVRDITKTQHCHLARQIRKRLKKVKIDKGVRCVFSDEIQDEDSLKMTDGTNYKRSFYGTISFMPAIFGLYAAAEVINYLTKKIVVNDDEL